MGATVRSSFETLIDPVPVQDFFQHYWAREYLIADGRRDRFSSLFSWDALSEVLSTHRFEFPRLRLLSGGRVAPPAQYMVRKVDRRGNPYTTHDPDAVSRMLQDGAMIHITSIGETWKPLAAFAAEIEPVLGGRVQVNLHAGFAGSRGFHTHWDGHDVYAAQIDGRKKWRLFGFTEDAPLAVAPDEKHGAPESHTWEGELGTGQMLYLPRGYWHATQFLDDPSLHLTFAVHHPNGIEFSQWLAGRLSQNGFARRDMPLPIFAISGSGKEAEAKYVEELRDLISKSVSQEALAEFVSEYRATLGRSYSLDLAQAQRSSHANR